MVDLSPERAKYLTGTDMKILMGLVPVEWGTPLDVYNHKVLGFQHHTEDNDAREWGRRLEDVVAQKFLDENPDLKLIHDNEFFHKGYFGGTIDRVFRDDDGHRVGLEVKTSSDSPWSYPPDHVLVQVHTYMLLDQADEWHVAALFNGRKYRSYRIERNEDLIQQIQERGDWFMEEHILPQIPPSEDERCESSLPDDLDPTRRNATTEQDKWFAEWMRLGGRIAELEAERSSVEAKLKGSYGNIKSLVFAGGFKLDYGYVNNKPSVDTKSLWEWAKQRLDPKECAAVEAQATKPGKSFRRFGKVTQGEPIE